LWWEWAGYQIGSRMVQTGMTSIRGFIKILKDIIFRVDYMLAFGLSEDDILPKLKKWQKHPRALLGGYASSLYIIAKTAKMNDINNIDFKSLVSWGDKLFPRYRKLIEAQFGVEVFDTYACTEGIMIAGECEYHNYHIMSPHVYVELLDENHNEVEPGELGYVVVSRLDNYSMPLVRYYLGDLAKKVVPDKICECGRKLPLLGMVVGRDTDIVKTPSGKYMIVHFFTAIFEHISEIKQFRVLQKKIDEIEIEYIPDRNFADDVLDLIRDKIQNHIKEKFPIHFKCVENISTTPSGKPQIVKSLI